MAFYRASIGGGGGGGSIDRYAMVDRDSDTAATTKTITGQNGKTLLMLVYMYAQSSNLPYDRYTSISVSGGSHSPISPLQISDARVSGTFHTLKVTSDTCTITCAYNMRIVVLEGVLT